VLVDGVRMNAFGGGFDFAQLSLGDIERIEVVRGPQSALYGSDAIGGVVQIITRHGGPTSIDGAIERGSFDTTRATLSATGSRDALSWGASAERLTTRGFTGVAPATGETVVNDDHDLTNIGLSGGWRRGSATRARGTLRLTSTERGYPGPFGSDPLGNVPAIDRISRGTTDAILGSADVTHAWSERIVQRLAVETSDLDGAFVSAFGRSASGTRRTSIRVQNDFTLHPDLRVAAGLEYLRERARSSFITGSTAEPIPIRRRIAGLFAEGRYDSGDRAAVTAGIRLEHIRRSALEPDPYAFQPRPEFGTDSVRSANPKLSVSYFLQPSDRRARAWTRLRFNAATGIRPPDAFEIAFTDNPSLAPERSRSVDVGIEQAVAGGAVVVEVTGFYNRYDDLIVAVGRSFADASQFRTDNISNARARGVELQGTLRTAWGLEARLGYTWLDTDVLAVDGASSQAPAPFDVGQPLLRRPRHQGSLDLALTRDRLTLHATLGARGGVLDVEPSFGAFGGLYSVPGYATLDLGGQLRLQRHLRLFARLTNAFDRAYEEAFGFPALGRAFTMGARIATGR
jgi:outer membrane cobalamin receptor